MSILSIFDSLSTGNRDNNTRWHQHMKSRQLISNSATTFFLTNFPIKTSLDSHFSIATWRDKVCLSLLNDRQTCEWVSSKGKQARPSPHPTLYYSMSLLRLCSYRSGGCWRLSFLKCFRWKCCTPPNDRAATVGRLVVDSCTFTRQTGPSGRRQLVTTSGTSH